MASSNDPPCDILSISSQSGDEDSVIDIEEYHSCGNDSRNCSFSDPMENENLTSEPISPDKNYPRMGNVAESQDHSLPDYGIPSNDSRFKEFSDSVNNEIPLNLENNSNSQAVSSTNQMQTNSVCINLEPLFYCHICNCQVEATASESGDYTCNRCNEVGFLERINDEEEFRQINNQSNASTSTSANNSTSSGLNSSSTLSNPYSTPLPNRIFDILTSLGIPIREIANDIQGDSPGVQLHSAGPFQSQPNDLLDLFGQGIVDPFDRHLMDFITRLSENDPNRYGAPPAAPRVVENLPREKISQEEAKIAGPCAICQEDYTDDDQVLKLSKDPIECPHVFHCDCIVPWLQQHNSCPVCRFELPTDDEDYERKKLELQNRIRERFSQNNNMAGATLSNLSSPNQTMSVSSSTNSQSASINQSQNSLSSTTISSTILESTVNSNSEHFTNSINNLSNISSSISSTQGIYSNTEQTQNVTNSTLLTPSSSSFSSGNSIPFSNYASYQSSSTSNSNSIPNSSHFFSNFSTDSFSTSSASCFFSSSVLSDQLPFNISSPFMSSHCFTNMFPNMENASTLPNGVINGFSAAFTYSPNSGSIFFTSDSNTYSRSNASFSSQSSSASSQQNSSSQSQANNGCRQQ